MQYTVYLYIYIYFFFPLRKGYLRPGKLQCCSKLKADLVSMIQKPQNSISVAHVCNHSTKEAIIKTCTSQASVGYRVTLCLSKTKSKRAVVQPTGQCGLHPQKHICPGHYCQSLTPAPQGHCKLWSKFNAGLGCIKLYLKIKGVLEKLAIERPQVTSSRTELFSCLMIIARVYVGLVNSRMSKKQNKMPRKEAEP